MRDRQAAPGGQVHRLPSGAEADAARDFTAPIFDKCENSYLLGWAKAEERARAKGAPCWTEGDASVVKGDIDAHTGSLAESLSGGK